MAVIERNKKKYFVTASGLEVELKPVSPLAFTPYKRLLKKPLPPVEDTDIGPVANETHPDYVNALETYKELAQEVEQALYIELGTGDVEIDHAAVAEIRKKMRCLPVPAELNQSDKVVYLAFVVCPSNAEFFELLDAIIELSRPTPGAVFEALDLLDVRFKDRPVLEFRLEKSGISSDQLYQWLNAGIAAGYKLHEFLELPGDIQSLVVAWYIAKQQSEGIIAREVQSEQAKQAKRQRLNRPSVNRQE